MRLLGTAEIPDYSIRISRARHTPAASSATATAEITPGSRQARGCRHQSRNPGAVLEEILPDLDLVVVMTVNPGFGHQHFLRSTLPKIGRVRQMVARLNPRCEVEVDGSVDETTAPLAGAAGADVFVAGSSIFGDHAGVAAAMSRLRASIVRDNGS